MTHSQHIGVFQYCLTEYMFSNTERVIFKSSHLILPNFTFNLWHTFTLWCVLGVFIFMQVRIAYQKYYAWGSHNYTLFYVFIESILVIFISCVIKNPGTATVFYQRQNERIYRCISNTDIQTHLYLKTFNWHVTCFKLSNLKLPFIQMNEWRINSSYII